MKKNDNNDQEERATTITDLTDAKDCDACFLWKNVPLRNILTYMDVSAYKFFFIGGRVCIQLVT